MFYNHIKCMQNYNTLIGYGRHQVPIWKTPCPNMEYVMLFRDVVNDIVETLVCTGQVGSTARAG